MRFLGTVGMFTYVTLALSGCTGHTMQDFADKEFNHKEEPSTVQAQKEEPVSPTKNKALTKVSPLNDGRADGTVQKSLDSWLETVWTPSVDKNETIKKIDENTSRNFTIQEYIDKAGVYIKNQPKSNEPSGVENLSKLPAIGK